MNVTPPRYEEPTLELIELGGERIVTFRSGWNYDGEHGGNVEEGGKDPEWGDND